MKHALQTALFILVVIITVTFLLSGSDRDPTERKDRVVSGSYDIDTVKEIESLIATLRYKEDKNVRKDAADQLRKITRKDLGDTYERWREWWGAERAGLTEKE